MKVELIAVLAIVWWWEWTGAVLFTALAVPYVVLAWGRFHWSAYLAISRPLLLTGALFLINCH